MEDEERVDGTGWAEGESAFGWEWRALIVSAVCAGPGLLLGGLLGIVTGLGSAEWWLCGGAVIGATLGVLLESDHLLG